MSEGEPSRIDLEDGLVDPWSVAVEPGLVVSSSPSNSAIPGLGADLGSLAGFPIEHDPDIPWSIKRPRRMLHHRAAPDGGGAGY